jgi:hypothetical protein
MENKLQGNKKAKGQLMSDMVSVQRKHVVFALSKKKAVAKTTVNYKKAVSQKIVKQSIVASVVEYRESEPLTHEQYVTKQHSYNQINLIHPIHHQVARKFAHKKMRVNLHLATFTLFIFFTAFLLQSGALFSKSLQATETAQDYASLALDDLKTAQALTEQKDFAGARQSFESAQKNFLSAKRDVDALGRFVNSLVKLTGAGKSAHSLLTAGSSISTAGVELNNFLAVSSQIKLTPQGFSTPDGFYETTTVARKHLSAVIYNLETAQKHLNNVDVKDLPNDLQSNFVTYKDQLDLSLVGLQKGSQIFALMQEFIGKGQKSFLLLFENNNELRPTGGFIGTYGFYKFDNGKIISQKISSVYDLDGQIGGKVAPPGPFFSLTDKWGLRDSNWFVDFASSARKASSFYELTGKETPDAVIAVTPDLFIDLLQVTGPIEFPKYNLTLSAENFREQVQLNTSVLYDKEINTPKQMLADFAPLLLQKLSEAEGSSSALFSSLVKNFAEKNILVYDRNPAVQSFFERYNWAGRIVETDRDYLAVYSTNLGGRKTDLAVDQQLKLESEVQNDGSVINTLTYKRDHQSDLTEHARNISYVRFLVPLGSQFVSGEGFTKKPFYPSDGSGYVQDPNNKFKIDPDLKAMDEQATIDAVSGTVIGKESGKTVFGNWIETEPGDSSVVKLKYKLPFKLNNTKKHSLTVQKQPGNPNIDFSYILWLNRPVIWSTPFEMKLEAGAIRYSKKLKSDLFIGAVLGDN